MRVSWASLMVFGAFSCSCFALWFALLLLLLFFFVVAASLSLSFSRSLLLLWLCVSKFMFAGYENEMTVVNILIKSKFGFCLRYNNIFCCRCCHSVSPLSLLVTLSVTPSLSGAAIFYFILHFPFFLFLLQQINCNFILPRFNLLSTFLHPSLVCALFSFLFSFAVCVFIRIYTLCMCAFILFASLVYCPCGRGRGSGTTRVREWSESLTAGQATVVAE